MPDHVARTDAAGRRVPRQDPGPMKIYDAREFVPDDGVRDPMRWSRFATPRMLAGGVGLAVVLVAISALGPEGAVRRDAASVASGVSATAHRVAAERARGALQGEPRP